MTDILQGLRGGCGWRGGAQRTRCGQQGENYEGMHLGDSIAVSGSPRVYTFVATLVGDLNQIHGRTLSLLLTVCDEELCSAASLFARSRSMV